MQTYKIQHFNKAGNHVEVTAAINGLVSTVNELEFRVERLEIQNDELVRITELAVDRCEQLENGMIFLRDQLNGKG